MKISRPKVSKLDTGGASRGAFGNGRGAGQAGQIKSGHHFYSISAGGSTPAPMGPTATGRPMQKRKAGRMY